MKRLIVIALAAVLAACSLVIPDVDVHARTVLGGYTPLHQAARRGSAAEVRTLIAAGADVNARDNASWTPLHHAVSFNSPEVVTTLLDAGADIRARDNVGARPLDYVKYNPALRGSWVIHRL